MIGSAHEFIAASCARTAAVSSHSRAGHSHLTPVSLHSVSTAFALYRYHIGSPAALRILIHTGPLLSPTLNFYSHGV